MRYIRVHTTVLPGGRVEVASPQLPEGADVDVIVVLPNRTEKTRSIIDFLDSLPPGPRSASTWDEVERDFQTERDAWDLHGA